MGNNCSCSCSKEDGSPSEKHSVTIESGRSKYSYRSYENLKDLNIPM